MLVQSFGLIIIWTYVSRVYVSFPESMGRLDHAIE